MKFSKHPASQVTLRQIAERLGVSLMTVSMALRNHPEISTSRRKQVQKTAKRMGYRPNAMAVALAQRRYDTMTHSIGAEIAWINCWKPPERLRSFKEFDLYWQGAQRTAESHGFRLEEFVVGPQLPYSRLNEILQSRNIRGLLFPPQGGCAETLPVASSLDWTKYSIVRFGYSIPHLAFHVVASNQLQSTMMAFKNTLDRGYRRIGYIYPIESNTYAKAGYLMFQSNLSPSERLPVLVMASEQSMSRRLQQLNNWIKKNRPDAILSEQAETPWMLKALGIRIPQDLGLATTSVLDGKVDAGIFQNSEEIGTVAVKTLISLLYHHETGIPAIYREVLINAGWRNGKTLPLRRPKVSLPRKRSIGTA